jgi:hypothetical protein
MRVVIKLECSTGWWRFSFFFFFSFLKGEVAVVLVHFLGVVFLYLCLSN